MSDIASELAAMRATLEAHMRAMELARAGIEEERLEAKNQRNAMSADISDIRYSAFSMESRVKSIESNLEDINPTIMKVRSWQTMALGAMTVLGMMGFAVSLFWEAVWEWLKRVISGDT